MSGSEKVDKSDPAILTFLAEDCCDVASLLRWAQSEHAVVREGAVLGLGRVLGDITSVLRRVADHDPSKGVRQAAEESLDV